MLGLRVETQPDKQRKEQVVVSTAEPTVGESERFKKDMGRLCCPPCHLF